MKTDKRLFEVVAPDPRAHRDDMFDLIAKVFPLLGYWAYVDFCREMYIDHGFYDWSASRIGLLDGRIVTHWGVWGYDMRVGSALLRAGGIGVVATAGDARKKGYMVQTALASIDAMERLGYDVSILFGIRDFYHRFGYVRAWTNTAYFLPAAEIPAGPSPRLRALTDMLDPRVVALANREYDGLTGTAVRPTYRRTNKLFGQQGRYWTDARGRLAGYVIVGTDRSSPARAWVSDAVGKPDDVLRAVGAIMRRRKMTEAKFSELHHDSRLAKALRQLNCRQETHHCRGGGPMIRMLNLRRCLAKMQGELTRRLSASTLARWTGRLLVADAREKVVLDIRRGKASVGRGAGAPHAVRGGDNVARLIIGADEPREIVRADGMKLTGDALPLIEALFPAQHPTLPSFDHY